MVKSKKILKQIMHEKGINIKKLSTKTGISLYRLILLMYIPFCTIKLTQVVAITKALNIGLSDLE